MKILHSKGAYTGGIKRVFIAVPSYGEMSCETVYSLFGAKEALLANNVESELFLMTGNCHIDDGRNYCIRNFLEGNCSDLIFVDSDVMFDPDDIVTLALSKRDVCAGVYPKKDEEETFPVQFIGGDIYSSADGMFEVAGVCSGFLKISRYALECLDKTVPHHLGQKETVFRKLIPIIFERSLHNHNRLGGDYEFCRKWRAVGGKIYVDPEMTFGHIGPTEWRGTLGHYLRKTNGLTEDHIVSIVKKIINNKETSKDINSLWEAWDNHWSPTAEMLSAVNMIAKDGAGEIFECGSGLTTLILGASGRKVHSVEHDKKWYNKITTLLNRCGLDNVSVELCDIKDGWYDTKIDGEYSLFIIDGPPRSIGSRAIFVDKLDRVGNGCVFVVDDAGTELDITSALSEKFNIKFNNFGRFAAGRTT